MRSVFIDTKTGEFKIMVGISFKITEEDHASCVREAKKINKSLTYVIRKRAGFEQPTSLPPKRIYPRGACKKN